MFFLISTFLLIVHILFKFDLCAYSMFRIYIYIYIFFLPGFFAPCSRPEVPSPLTLLAESLPSESNEQTSAPSSSHGNRNRCPVPGIIYNTNTLESFNGIDKQSLLKAEAKKVCSVLLTSPHKYMITFS